jgi:hypothetical protein
VQRDSDDHHKLLLQNKPGLAEGVVGLLRAYLSVAVLFELPVTNLVDTFVSKEVKK